MEKVWSLCNIVIRSFNISGQLKPQSPSGLYSTFDMTSSRPVGHTEKEPTIHSEWGLLGRITSKNGYNSHENCDKCQGHSAYIPKPRRLFLKLLYITFKWICTSVIKSPRARVVCIKSKETYLCCVAALDSTVHCSMKLIVVLSWFC